MPLGRASSAVLTTRRLPSGVSCAEIANAPDADEPALERVHQAAGDQVAFVGLAVADQESAARDLAERTGVSYELGFDPTSKIIRESGGAFLPTTVFVDESGTIVESHVGAIEDQELRDKLQAHFGVSVPPGP